MERAEIGRLLGEHRLITLIGPAGCGKSCLALEVATSLLESFPEGAWLVELDALSDPRLVPQAVATVLQVHEEPGQPLLETLGEGVVGRRLLLVLDNCEHLIGACAEIVQRDRPDPGDLPEAVAGARGDRLLAAPAGDPPDGDPGAALRTHAD